MSKCRHLAITLLKSIVFVFIEGLFAEHPLYFLVETGGRDSIERALQSIFRSRETLFDGRSSALYISGSATSTSSDTNYTLQ